MMRLILLATLGCLMALPSIAQRRSRSDEGDLRRPDSIRGQGMRRMSSAKYKDILGRPGNGPAVGTVAPDFELEPLEDHDFGVMSSNGADPETDSTLRLSTFKGLKPVVLIFGSYT